MKDKKMRPEEQTAKMSVLQDMRKHAMDMMGGNLKGLGIKKEKGPNGPKGAPPGEQEELGHEDGYSPNNFIPQDAQEDPDADGGDYGQRPDDFTQVDALEEDIEPKHSMSPSDIDRKIEILMKLKQEMGK